MPRPIGQRLIAFLRAVNVGGRIVPMARLRDEFMALGFTDVETFIASGNVIFTARAGATRTIETKIEARLQQAFGFDVTTFVRTVDEVAAVAACQPFPPAEITNGATVYVGFVEKPLDAAAARAVMAFKTEADDFRVKGREVYWLRKTRQSDRPFKYVSLEKALKIRATFRGRNTIERLAAKHASS
jgi:uncharacterized protein (DUF1697 family)